MRQKPPPASARGQQQPGKKQTIPNCGTGRAGSTTELLTINSEAGIHIKPFFKTENKPQPEQPGIPQGSEIPFSCGFSPLFCRGGVGPTLLRVSTLQSSPWLCWLTRTLSAEVMQPLQARQSFRVILAFSSFCASPSYKKKQNRLSSDSRIYGAVPPFCYK